MGFPRGSVVKNLPAKQEIRVRSLVWEESPEKEMATHYSVPAWEIPRTGEPGGLQVMGSLKSRTQQRPNSSSGSGCQKSPQDRGSGATVSPHPLWSQDGGPLTRTVTKAGPSRSFDDHQPLGYQGAREPLASDVFAEPERTWALRTEETLRLSLHSFSPESTGEGPGGSRPYGTGCYQQQRLQTSHQIKGPRSKKPQTLKHWPG